MPGLRFATGLLVATLLLSGGCVRSASLASWEAGVEQYVKKNGGDPVALSGVTLEDARAGFAVIGDLDPRKTTDARALLLGHQPVAGRPSFIYLVGVVKNQSVQDIRLAVVSFDAGKAVWRLGQKNSASLKRYRAGGVDLWHQRSSDRRIPPEYRTFPRQSDDFQLAINGALVQATHAQTGAVFTVEVTWPSDLKR